MNSSIPEKLEILTSEFFENAPRKLDLEILSGGEHLARRSITSRRIQKLGLALAGFRNYIHAGRLQVVGRSETSYLEQLDQDLRLAAIANLELEKICCVLVTKAISPPSELVEVFAKAGIPVMRTPLVSSAAIGEVTGFLEKALAPNVTMHGVLLGMYGIGVLLLGESGIGKSECALDLVARGFRLIADDTVVIRRIGDSLEGSPHPLTSEHLEIRGLGIINIKELFGVSAVGPAKSVDLCIGLERWENAEDGDRLGLETEEEEFFGVCIPKFSLPVSSGRNLSTLVETAVRVHLLKISGYDAAQKLIAEHTRAVSGEK